MFFIQVKSDISRVELQFGSLVWHTEGITTKGEAEDTEAEARESAAEAAILSLEMVCSVYLIDITYNKRSLTEARVLEAESAQLLSEIQPDWEGEVGKLDECTDHYKNILTEHDSIDYSEELFLVKWECTEPIVVLHEACPTRIQNRRLQP
jgi:hypothetical protein